MPEPPAYSLYVVSLDIGSATNTSSVAGATEHAVPIKPIDGFLLRFEALEGRVLERKGKARLALVGAGAAGLELVLAVERRLRQRLAQSGCDPAGLSCILVSASACILPSFRAAFRRRFERVLQARGIVIAAGAEVARVGAGVLHRSYHEPVLADEILWATHAAAPAWLAQTGLALDRGGFVQVDATLRAKRRAQVFAAGDVAAFGPGAIPKSGVYAVRTGPVLADNIRRTVAGKRLRSYRSQREALYLVSTGGRHAVGTRNGLVFEGAWVWRWKDWLDRCFMARFNDLPEGSQERSRRLALLIDPQTAGGLLASVPAHAPQARVAALKAAVARSADRARFVVLRRGSSPALSARRHAGATAAALEPAR